ncbi:putative membrane protein [Salmonella enterica]|uniref:Putative membrane protein n=1 Tax=Salmonella enterica TaxID=28901 RepID=A0A7D8IR92_SALER|nr:putative membrane protein [Salmonella enterica]
MPLLPDNCRPPPLHSRFLQLKSQTLIYQADMPSFPLYTLHTSRCLCVGNGLLGPSMGLALTGRRTRRSNLLPADLLLSPVTALSMLPGTHSLATFKQLELFWVYISELLFLSVFIFQFIYY